MGRYAKPVSQITGNHVTNEEKARREQNEAKLRGNHDNIKPPKGTPKEVCDIFESLYNELKELEILDGNKAFNISTNWKWLGIFVYNNDVNYDTTNIIFNGSEDVLNLNYGDRVKYWNEIMFSDKLGNIIKKTKNLYDSLKSKYKTLLYSGIVILVLTIIIFVSLV